MKKLTVNAAISAANGAPTYRFCSLGKASVPIVYVIGNCGFGKIRGTGSGVNHSQSLESFFMNFPGLKIVAPFYPSDVYGILRASIRDDDPVVFYYDKGYLGFREEVSDEQLDSVIDLNDAGRVVREGTDVTIVAWLGAQVLATQAADQLAEMGISAEIVDPRVLVPLDTKTIMKSVRKTGKLVIAHEAHTRGSFAGEIVRCIMEESADAIKKPIKVVGSLNSPIPCGYGEKLMMPQTEDIVNAVKNMM